MAKRPRDPNQLTKLIVDMATGDAPPDTTDNGKDPSAVAMGRKGGLKGGKARARQHAGQAAVGDRQESG